MKLPSVYIAVCLAAGILGGPLISARLAHALPLLLAAASLALVVGFFLAAARRPASAWGMSLAAWCLLGGAAALGEPLALPPNHVSRLMSEKLAGAPRLDLS